jgi:hypothetical protein
VWSLVALTVTLTFATGIIPVAASSSTGATAHDSTNCGVFACKDEVTETFTVSDPQSSLTTYAGETPPPTITGGFEVSYDSSQTGTNTNAKYFGVHDLHINYSSYTMGGSGFVCPAGTIVLQSTIPSAPGWAEPFLTAPSYSTTQSVLNGMSTQTEVAGAVDTNYGVGSLLLDFGKLSAGINTSTNNGACNYLGFTIDGKLTFGKTVPVTARPTTTAPAAGLAVALSSPQNIVQLGGTLNVTVKVTAKGAAVSAISLGEGLTFSNNAATVANSPPTLSGFALASGASRTFQFTIKGVNSGKVTLSVSASGTSGSKSITGSDTLTLKVGSKQPLSVTVKWLHDGVALATDVNGTEMPDTLQLADGPTAELPDFVVAQVIVKNVSKTTQTNISINGIPPFSYATQAQSVRVLPVRVTKGPDPSAKIATLPPGEVAPTVSYDVKVSNNGVFNFSPQVLSATKGSTATTVSLGKGQLTVLPTALLWLSLHSLETDLVAPGTPVLIGGEVTNRSLTQTLNLDPLIATIDGYAGGGDLVDQASQPLADGVDLPFSGKIAPGDTIDVIGEVGTSFIPGSRATVDYQPTGKVIAPDGTETDLGEDDVGSVKDSLPIPISLNVSDPPPPPSDIETVTTNFVDSTFFYAAKYSYLGYAGLGDLIQHPIDSVSKAAGAIPAVLVAAGSSLATTSHAVASIFLLGTIGQSLTDEELQAWSAQITSDFMNGNQNNEIRAAVSKAAYNAFVPFETAMVSGDYNTVASLTGQGFGAGLNAAQDALLSDIIFQKILIGLGQVPSAIRSVSVAAGEATSSATSAIAEATGIKSALQSAFAKDLTLAQALKDARITQSLGKGLPGIESGQNLLLAGAAALTDIYGLTKAQITALQEFCRTNKLIVAVRSRSKKAAELIERGLAVGKNEIIKIKNVSEIDVDYLGYSAVDMNTIVWAEPVPIEYVYDQLALRNADALTKEVVLQRFALREAEWVNPKINKVIKTAEKDGTIPWDLDGSGNDADILIKQTRNFELKTQASKVSGKKYPLAKDRTYQQVLVSNKPLEGGVLPKGSLMVPVTQDVDMMAILTADGQILSAQLRAEAYEYLSNILGIQHGETPSWILDGEIIFQAKAKQLADAIPGGEALAVFGPDGSVTAGFYNAALSTFNNVTKTGTIFFDGGYNNAYYLLKQQISVALGNFANGL